MYSVTGWQRIVDARIFIGRPAQRTQRIRGFVHGAEEIQRPEIVGLDSPPAKGRYAPLGAGV